MPRSNEHVNIVYTLSAQLAQGDVNIAKSFRYCAGVNLGRAMCTSTGRAANLRKYEKNMQLAGDCERRADAEYVALFIKAEKDGLF